MIRYFLCLPLLILLGLAASLDSVAEEAAPASTDPIHHALIQKRVGIYAVYLPPGYHSSEDKAFPVCVILHGHGSSETGHGGLSNSFGRDGVIYVAPRAPYMHKGLLAQGQRGYTAWPTPPEGMDGSKLENLKIGRLYTDWIAECVADVRERYRTSDERVVVVGHSQGAMFSLTLALHRPELVRAHFAYAGYFADEMEDDIAAQTLKKHEIYSYISHCDGDEVVNAEGSRKLVEYFKEHDVPHDALFVEGGGHGFNSKVMRAAQEFVAKWCRGTELPPLEGKVVVTGVVEDSQAAEIGMKEGDVITSYNGKAVKSMDDLTAAIAAAAEAESIEVEWLRGEEEKKKATVKPGRLGVMLADR